MRMGRCEGEAGRVHGCVGGMGVSVWVGGRNQLLA